MEEFQDVSENVILNDYSNEYTQYFDYLVEETGIPKPAKWMDTLNLYRYILSVC